MPPIAVYFGDVASICLPIEISPMFVSGFTSFIFFPYRSFLLGFLAVTVFSLTERRDIWDRA
jgi:hypothetical protein